MRSRLPLVLVALVVALFASGCQAIVAIPALVVITSRTSSAAPAYTGLDYSNVPQGRTDDGAFFLGRADAPLTVIVFEDFLCSHCQAYQTTLNQFITAQVFTGKARLEYRFFPVIDPLFSYTAATLTECADMLQPGSFWKAHDVMFAMNVQARFGMETAGLFAEQMDLNQAALTDCSANKAHQVDVDKKYGESLGVQSTPTVFIQYGSGDPILQSPAPNADQLAALGK